MLQSDRIGFALVIDQSWVTAGGCIPPHHWLQAVADWLQPRSGEAQPADSSVHGSGCLFDARLYDEVLQHLPEAVRDLICSQPLSGVFCSSHLSSERLAGLPCFFSDGEQCSGMLASMTSSSSAAGNERHRVGAFFFQSPASKSAGRSAGRSAHGTV